MNTQLTEKFEQALIYATRLHAKQRRKTNGIPYISHLLSVAALVLEDGGSEAEAIAALLHDAVEDQGGAATRQDILHRFGEQVVAIVEGCTESDTDIKPPWRERKQGYLKKVRQGSDAVRRVALADKLHNARSLVMETRCQGEEIWSVFSAGKQGTLWFYHAFLDLYRTPNPSPMVAELAQVVSTLE